MDYRRGLIPPVAVRGVDRGTTYNGYQPLTLRTSRGEVACRYYRPPAPERAMLWVGGVGGGWDSPALDLYPRVASQLLDDGIGSLRVRYRFPTILDEAVADVLAGASFLKDDGVTAIALIGHSLGGAVVIEAAATEPSVRTVVALATQSYGADPVARLSPRCSLLLVHGMADTVLPPSASLQVHRLAGEPKRLMLYDGAGHSLDEVADDVEEAVRSWLRQELGEG